MDENNLQNPDAEKPKERVEAEKKYEQKKQDIQNNAQTAKVAAKVVATAYFGKEGGVAVDVASKTKVGQAVFNTVGKAVKMTTDNTGIAGKMLQKNLNRLNQSGVVNMADKATSLYNGSGKLSGTEAANALNKASDGLNKANKVLDNRNSNSNYQEKEQTKEAIKDEKGIQKEEKNIEKEKKKKRRTAFFIGGTVLSLLAIPIIIVVLVATFIGGFLDLTEIIYNPSAKPITESNNGSNVGTGSQSFYNTTASSEKIESSLLYIGDSRTNDMQTMLKKSSVSYASSENANYNWLASYGRAEIDNAIKAKNIKYVIFMLGLYDLQNVDRYINIFNSIKAKYPDVQFYFASVNPVKDNLLSNNRYNISTSKIISFNSRLSSALSDEFIDTYKILGNSFETTDGIRYKPDVYSKIHNYIVSYIQTKSSEFLCGGTFTNYYQYNYQESYGYGTTIASSGCGPTSMAMVLTYYLQRTIDPVEAANWSLRNGYRVKDNGTDWDYFPAIASAYNIQGNVIPLSANSIYENLNSCKLIVASMACCTFTKKGHFIVLVGVKDGNILVADPASESRSSQSWDINIFLREAQQLWAFSK